MAEAELCPRCSASTQIKSPQLPEALFGWVWDICLLLLFLFSGEGFCALPPSLVLAVSPRRSRSDHVMGCDSLIPAGKLMSPEHLAHPSPPQPAPHHAAHPTHPGLLGHLGSPLPVGTSAPAAVPSPVAVGKCPLMARNPPQCPQSSSFSFHTSPVGKREWVPGERGGAGNTLPRAASFTEKWDFIKSALN